MLERIMDLHLLLYTMTALGALGAVGMLAVHLTYRRAMRKTKAVMNLKEKWLTGTLEDQGQASQQDESSCVGTVASFSGVPGTGSFLATRLELKDGLSMQYLCVFKRQYL